MEEEINDLAMQTGWNQLFQQFVSELFSELPELSTPVVTIDDIRQEGDGLGNILHTLRQNIDFVRSKYARDFIPSTHLPETNHLSVLVEGLALYLRAALSKPQFDALSTQLSAAAEHWLFSIFQNKIKTNQSKGIFSINESMALLQICKIAILQQYPDYEVDGYLAFHSKQPIIYYTYKKFTKSLLQLGLPKSSLRLVKDHQQFNTQLQVDLKADNTAPLMVIAHTGAGHHDDLLQFYTIAKEHSLWIHVTGEDLSLLVTQTPDRINIVSECDSFTINPGEWYGLATPSSCTIVKEGVPPAAKKFTSKEDMLALTLWVVIQFVGKEQLKALLDQARVLSKELYSSLKNDESIVIYSPEDPLTVIFRYSPITKPERLFHLDFLNNLNTQVLIDLGETASRLGLDITTVDKYCCVRFRPLSFPNLMGISASDITKFTESIRKATSCINATLSCATSFEEAIQSCEGLHCVHVRNFVGIGAVRYLPPFFRGSELSADVSDEINHLNLNLAKQLSEIDPLFSVGKTVEGQTCICLGVETKPINHQSAHLYAKLILDTMKSMDIFVHVQKKIEAIILKGIKEAENEITKESEKVEQQKGLFRQIPLVSSVVNWWSPVKQNVAGKTFDILTTSLKDASPVSPKTPSNHPNRPPKPIPFNLNTSGDFDVPTEPLPVDLVGLDDDHDDDGHDDDHDELNI